MIITVEQIGDGIVRQEGMPATFNNPGNLRGAPWFAKPLIVNGFWVPDSRQMGLAGLHHLIALHRAQGNTLRDFIAGHPGVYAGFAPGSDHNKPDAYIANLMLWTGIPSADVPLWDFVL